MLNFPDSWYGKWFSVEIYIYQYYVMRLWILFKPLSLLWNCSSGERGREMLFHCCQIRVRWEGLLITREVGVPTLSLLISSSLGKGIRLCYFLLHDLGNTGNRRGLISHLTENKVLTFLFPYSFSLIPPSKVGIGAFSYRLVSMQVQVPHVASVRVGRDGDHCFLFCCVWLE